MALSLKHAFNSAKGDGADPTKVQPSHWNAEHTITVGANKVLGGVGAGAVSEIDCTAAGRALIDDADAAAQRTTLGLGALAVKSTVLTADIVDANVTTAKIADANVTTVKIADSNVTTAKIANANVTLAKLDTALVAVKADQGTGASPGAGVSKFVQPGVQQYHPAAAKAWVRFHWTGAAIVVDSAYNVPSVSRNATGVYVVNFTTAFANSVYIPIANAQRTTSVGAWMCDPAIVSASQCVIVVSDSGGVNVDPNFVTAVFFGDQ